MGVKDPVHHADTDACMIAGFLETESKLLSMDIRRLHTTQTTKGKPKRIWYKDAVKRVKEVKSLLELVEEDLQEVGKAWKEKEV